MRVIEIKNIGPEFQLILSEKPVPTPQNGEVLIKVSYAGVNRPDLLQALGKYTLPADASDIPGLEVSGVIEGTDRLVCALTNGGGYAEYVCVPATQVLSLPETVSLEAAAALPEAFFTIWQNLILLGKFKEGCSVLIHGGTSGIGTTAIQIAKAMGASFIATTVRHQVGIDLCHHLGADQVINTALHDFSKKINQPVDIVLDMMGGDYFEKNLSILAPFGRHVSIAALRGPLPALPISVVMVKNLTLTGSVLRPQSKAQKADLARQVQNHLFPLVAKEAIKPVLDCFIPLSDAQTALKSLQKGGVQGKILLFNQGVR